MKQTEYKFNNVFNNPDQIIQRIVALENQINDLNQTLNNIFVKGCLRTDRTAPTSSADVQTPDRLYDRVLKNDYEYILIDNAGALAWRRIAISVF
jgi:hypothetical protein